jgi:hypothetical protein
MNVKGNEEKIKELEKKLEKYEKKLADRKLGYGEVTRTGSGDSYSDQLRDDTNALQGIINSTKAAIESLKK